MTTPHVSVDGRRARRDRNRDAVIDAVISLMGDGNLRPSAQAIAYRSGVSLRSVFRYFSDLDELVQVSLTRQWDNILPVVDLEGQGGSLAERVEQLVDRQLLLYPKLANFYLAARIRAPFHPEISALLAGRARLVREAIGHHLAPELLALPDEAAQQVLSLVHELVRLDSIHHLLGSGLDEARVRASLCVAVERLLTTDPPAWEGKGTAAVAAG